MGKRHGGVRCVRRREASNRRRNDGSNHSIHTRTCADDPGQTSTVQSLRSRRKENADHCGPTFSGGEKDQYAWSVGASLAHVISIPRTPVKAMLDLRYFAQIAPPHPGRDVTPCRIETYRHAAYPPGCSDSSRTRQEFRRWPTRSGTSIMPAPLIPDEPI
jgi:hypothetical protein